MLGLEGQCRTTTAEASGLKKDVEFVVVADNRPIHHPPQKVVLLVKQRHGVTDRFSIAEIEKDAGVKSVPKVF